MQISEDQITKFQKLMLAETGVQLGMDESADQASRLIQLFNLITKYEN